MTHPGNVPMYRSTQIELLNSKAKSYWFSKLYNGKNGDSLPDIKELTSLIDAEMNLNYEDMVTALKLN